MTPFPNVRVPTRVPRLFSLRRKSRTGINGAGGLAGASRLSPTDGDVARIGVPESATDSVLARYTAGECALGRLQGWIQARRPVHPFLAPWRPGRVRGACGSRGHRPCPTDYGGCRVRAREFWARQGSLAARGDWRALCPVPCRPCSALPTARPSHRSNKAPQPRCRR